MKLKQLQELILSVKADAKNLEPQHRLRQDTGLCSFDMRLLLVALDQKYGLRIPMALLHPEMTVSDLLDAICKAKAKQD